MRAVEPMMMMMMMMMMCKELLATLDDGVLDYILILLT
jgi:hypothetical protein